MAYWFDLGEGVVPLSVFLISLLNMYTAPTSDTNFDKYDEMRLHMQRLLSASLIEFDIPMKIIVPLDNAGIRRLKDLVCKSRKDLMKINRLGEKSLSIIERLLYQLGLSLEMNIK